MIVGRATVLSGCLDFLPSEHELRVRSHVMEWETIDISGLPTIAIAAGLGALLGLEREIARKPAGIRTNIFVCAGAALMMILGGEIIEQFQENESPGALTADPIRVLQAIVVGISFLGAGTIIHDRESGVEGLTTAATIFLNAGIGVAVAVNRVSLAVTITLSAIFILVLLGWLERRAERRWGGSP